MFIKRLRFLLNAHPELNSQLVICLGAALQMFLPPTLVLVGSEGQRGRCYREDTASARDECPRQSMAAPHASRRHRRPEGLCLPLAVIITWLQWNGCCCNCFLTYEIHMGQQEIFTITSMTGSMSASVSHWSLRNSPSLSVERMNETPLQVFAASVSLPPGCRIISCIRSKRQN